MSNIKILFDMASKLKEVAKDKDAWEINRDVMAVFEQTFSSNEEILRKALEAYSTQGFYASPQVNKKTEYHQRFFDWSLINLVRRTDITPTNHQLIMLSTYELIIQYLITGGFKSKNVDVTNESLLDEFSESRSFMVNVMGVKNTR